MKEYYNFYKLGSNKTELNKTARGSCFCLCPHDYLIYGTFQTTEVSKKYPNKKCLLLP